MHEDKLNLLLVFVSKVSRIRFKSIHMKFKQSNTVLRGNMKLLPPAIPVQELSPCVGRHVPEHHNFPLLVYW